MTKIEIQIHENVIDVYNKIKNINDEGIEIDIPEGSVLFDSVLNIKLLKKLVHKEGKEISLLTTDKHGESILNIVEDNYSIDSSPYIKYEPNKSIKEKIKNIKLNKLFKFVAIPKIDKPKIENNNKLPISKIGIILLPLLIVVLTATALYFTLSNMHKADVKIVVESQTLSRSITINVVKDQNNDFDNNIIKGIEVQQTISNKDATNTTGEKIEGDKATGNVTIYNRTSEDKTFEKGEVLILNDDDDEYKFVLLDDVTVDKRTDNDENPEEAMIPGENEVEVEAIEIGDEYNFGKDKTLEFDDYDSSDYIAKNNSEIKGGNTEIISIVTQEDMNNLKQIITEKNNSEVIELLENSNTLDIKYIKGSQNIKIIDEKFSDDLNEEATTLELEQTSTATGLAYSINDIENLIKNNLDSLIPQGFEILEQDTELNIEVLSNISSNNAELQVTVRLYIAPNIDSLNLKQNLKSKNIEEVQNIINEIDNIKTYQINIYPNISLFKKFPSDIEKINVEIENE